MSHHYAMLKQNHICCQKEAEPAHSRASRAFPPNFNNFPPTSSQLDNDTTFQGHGPHSSCAIAETLEPFVYRNRERTMPIARRYIVRSCKQRGWTIQPQALLGILDLAASEDDVE